MFQANSELRAPKILLLSLEDALNRCTIATPFSISKLQAAVSANEVIVASQSVEGSRRHHIEGTHIRRKLEEDGHPQVEAMVTYRVNGMPQELKSNAQSCWTEPRR